MKTFKTLIKYYSKQLDEKRRLMAQLEQQKADLQAMLAKLAEDLKKEQEFAYNHPEMQFAYADYAKRMELKKQHAKSSLLEVEKRIQPLSEEILELFSELKKYEIALEHKIQEQLEKEKRAETIMLDEIASTQYTRGEDSEF